MRVTITTRYTADIIRSFKLRSVFTKDKNYLKYILFEFLTIGLSALFYINEGLTAFTIALPFIVPIIVVTCIVLTLFSAKKQTEAVENTIINIIVDSESVAITCTSPTTSGTSHYKYFEEVSESKTAFYVYVGQGLAYVIAKRDIVEGDANALRELLKSKTSTFAKM